MAFTERQLKTRKIMEKICKKCQKVLLLEDFYLRQVGTDNYHNFCKKCILANQRMYYNKRKDSIKDQMK